MEISNLPPHYILGEYWLFPQSPGLNMRDTCPLNNSLKSLPSDFTRVTDYSPYLDHWRAVIEKWSYGTAILFGETFISNVYICPC